MIQSARDQGPETLFRGKKGDYATVPSYLGIILIINQYKDPYQTTSISWKVRVFFFFSCFNLDTPETWQFIYNPNFLHKNQANLKPYKSGNFWGPKPCHVWNNFKVTMPGGASWRWAYWFSSCIAVLCAWAFWIRRRRPPPRGGGISSLESKI